MEGLLQRLVPDAGSLDSIPRFPFAVRPVVERNGSEVEALPSALPDNCVLASDGTRLSLQSGQPAPLRIGDHLLVFGGSRVRGEILALCLDADWVVSPGSWKAPTVHSGAVAETQDVAEVPLARRGAGAMFAMFYNNRPPPPKALSGGLYR